MCAAPDDLDAKLVVRGECRSRTQRELADRQARPVVRAEHRFHREPLEEPVPDHGLRTAAAFLGGLEHEVHGAVEVPLSSQVLGGPEQHRRVTVVSAGMHPTRMPAGVQEPVLLGDRQRVDVCTQPDRTRRAAVPQHADDPCPGEPAVHLDAPALERSRDDV